MDVAGSSLETFVDIPDDPIEFLMRAQEQAMASIHETQSISTALNPTTLLAAGPDSPLTPPSPLSSCQQPEIPDTEAQSTVDAIPTMEACESVMTTSYPLAISVRPPTPIHVSAEALEKYLITENVLPDPVLPDQISHFHNHNHDPIDVDALPSPTPARPTCLAVADLSASAEMTSTCPLPESYLITLPFSSSRRAYYVDVITKSEHVLAAYTSWTARCGPDTSAVLVDRPSVPETEKTGRVLAAAVNVVFSRLTDVSDYPIDDLSEMNRQLLGVMVRDAMQKLALETNSKYLFIYQLIQALRDVPQKILIAARSTKILRTLFAVLLPHGVSIILYRADSQVLQSARPSHDTRLAISLCWANQKPPPDETFDVIIGFDFAFNKSSAAAHFTSPSSSRSRDRPILILELVLAYSLEHFDHYVSSKLDRLDRLKALVWLIWHGRSLITGSNYSDGRSTLAIANHFANYIRERYSHFAWEPLRVPQQFLSYHKSLHTPNDREAQGEGDEADGVGARKRKYIEDTQAEDMKRARSLGPVSDEATNVVGDGVKPVLKNDPSSAGSRPEADPKPPAAHFVTWSRADFEQKVEDQKAVEVRYRNLIHNLEASLCDLQSSLPGVHHQYQAALEERSKFESNAKEARKEAEIAEAQAATLQARVAELESILVSSDATAAVADRDAQLASARQAVAKLEHRLRNAQSDLDYSRDAYQKASTSAAEAAVEVNRQRERAEVLETKAAATILDVQRLNDASQSRDLLRMLKEQRALVSDRDRELDRLREEVHALRLVRRETRASSVPRSPRPPRSLTASASRGNSPAPLDQPGALQNLFSQSNGRWKYLRE